MREYLDMVTDGKIRRLMFNLPPRHGKTEQNTVRYPVYRMIRKPDTRCILGAYNQDLAKKFSRKALRLAEICLPMAEHREVADWETDAGGGMRAVGVGSGVTGMGADLIVIDDPVKSREEADSVAYRDRCWEWYKDDLWTRQEPGAAIILTMTRWHEDDLAGRLMAEEESGGEPWTKINLPAEAEDNDPLGRAIGEPLCSARADAEQLERAKMVLGNSYYALYQGRPQPKEGSFFKRFWFDGRFVDAVPVNATRVRYWDKASTEGGGTYSVGVLMLRVGYDYFVEDVVRGQWSSGQRNAKIYETAGRDHKTYSGKVVTWVEQEPGSGGKESAEITVSELAGFTVRIERVTGDKMFRAEPFASQAEYGHVYIKKAPWNTGYMDELCTFPTGKYKDQVDGSSGAFNKLALKRVLRF